LAACRLFEGQQGKRRVRVRVTTAFNRTPYLPGASVRACRSSGGRSGASGDGWLGFSELADEVGLGHVRLVLARAKSLACCPADCHRLLDMCALTGTLIADFDGVYSPADFNDRLLLGLRADRRPSCTSACHR
jgi:hypothetical protein